MTVKQISVFLENRPGALAEFTKILESSDIDLRALSLAESEDFGIVRVIVDDPFATIQVLKNEGYICSVTKVIAVEITMTRRSVSSQRTGSVRSATKIWRNCSIKLFSGKYY